MRFGNEKARPDFHDFAGGRTRGRALLGAVLAGGGGRQLHGHVPAQLSSTLAALPPGYR